MFKRVRDARLRSGPGGCPNEGLDQLCVPAFECHRSRTGSKLARYLDQRATTYACWQPTSSKTGAAARDLAGTGILYRVLSAPAWIDRMARLRGHAPLRAESAATTHPHKMALRQVASANLSPSLHEVTIPDMRPIGQDCHSRRPPIDQRMEARHHIRERATEHRADGRQPARPHP